MTRRPRRLSLLTVGATAIFVFAACGGAGTATPTTPPVATPVPGTPVAATPTGAPDETPATTPAESPAETPAGSPAAETQSPAPSESAPVATPAGTPYPDPLAQPPAPAEGMTAYPDPSYGTVTCATETAPGTFNGRPYSGNLKLIKAIDPMTIEFDFCAPDVAFLSQIAFNSLAIDDAAYLIAHMPTSVTAPDSEIPEGSILTTPMGTGPYKFGAWDRGNSMSFVRNDDYWGKKAATPNLIFQWSDQSASRLLALQAGTVDGIDNPGKDDLPQIEADSNLKTFARQGLNTFYLGMNVNDAPWTDIKVRQAIAMGIDRQRLVDNFYPPGSEVADYFTPCAIPNGCGGDAYYKFDPEAAKQLLKDAGFENGFETKIQFRDADRSYISNQPVIAQEIAAQLQDNLGITATIDQQDSGTFLDNNAAGKLDGLFMLGWGADFPDASNFLDYHFGPGTGKKFGTGFPDLVKTITQGDQTPKDAARTAAYTKANNLIKKYVPAVFISHAGSYTAFKADVAGAYAAPLQEAFAGMKAGDRDTLVFMQNKEPLSTYCGDESDGETLRGCNQIKESLYGYGGETGLDVVPALATKCTPNGDLTVWTCKLREGVKFHDGTAFAADDVILSFALQWDALNPLHVGRTAAFEYWAALIGQGYLNPPAPCGLPNSAPCT